MRLLDTCACIRLLNDAASPSWVKLRACRKVEIFVCDVVKAELYYGVEKSRYPERNLRHLEGFLEPFESLPFDGDAARACGKIKAELTRTGPAIGANDLLIAAIAVANDMTVVTHNTREFSRVSGLRIEDWEKP